MPNMDRCSNVSVVILCQYVCYNDSFVQIFTGRAERCKHDLLEIGIIWIWGRSEIMTMGYEFEI